LKTSSDGVSLCEMSYREPDAPSTNSPLRSFSRTLVATGAGLLLFITWHQSIVASDPKRYGIEFP